MTRWKQQLDVGRRQNSEPKVPQFFMPPGIQSPTVKLRKKKKAKQVILRREA
jgi:hypothetical protein